jgi:uncharacterized protein (DUF58 family)
LKADVINSSTTDATRFLDAKALLAIRNLELRARVVVEGFILGLHRSPYHGFSVEFSEYRQYSPGDDVRYVDWKLYGRSDRYYLKKFEDETNLRCYFLMDMSRSMGFGSETLGGKTKADYGITVAASLAYFLSRQGDAVGLLTFDSEIRDYLPARNRPGHVHQLILTLDKQTSGKETNLGAPLERIAELVRKRGLMILISDLLSPIETFREGLTQLRSFGHEVAVFQILDKQELEFNYDASAQFEDLETGANLYIDPEKARAEYLTNINAHQAKLRDLCNAQGITHQIIRADQPVELALFQFLTNR